MHCIHSLLRTDIVWQNGQVKIMLHHLVWLTSGGVSLPANLGHGSSISHLCDNSCVRIDHLELTTHHIDNLVRQRCTGVTLVVAKNFIVSAEPCAHARGGTFEEKVETSCRKVRVVKVGLEPLEEVVRLSADMEVDSVNSQSSTG